MKEMNEMEKVIQKLENEIAQLKSDSFKEENYSDHNKLQEINNVINMKQEVLEENEMNYLELLDLHERKE